MLGAYCLLGTGLVLKLPGRVSIPRMLQMSNRGSAPRNPSLIWCYDGAAGTDHSMSFYEGRCPCGGSRSAGCLPPDNESWVADSDSFLRMDGWEAQTLTLTLTTLTGLTLLVICEYVCPFPLPVFPTFFPALVFSFPLFLNHQLADYILLISGLKSLEDCINGVKKKK